MGSEARGFRIDGGALKPAAEGVVGADRSALRCCEKRNDVVGKVGAASSDWGRWSFGVEKDLVGRRRVRGSDDDEGKEGREGIGIVDLPSQLPLPEPELEAEEPDRFLS